jgi:hypothetical protein
MVLPDVKVLRISSNAVTVVNKLKNRRATAALAVYISR